MKYNKLQAFTLAEVMILLLTLSILLAAFSPVFTVRYKNSGNDDVWSYVTSDDGYDAYFDNTSKTLTAQAFIGMTPTGAGDVAAYSKDGDSDTLYSKLVIRASDRVNSISYLQNQMLFRYGSSATGGFVGGSLFAGNNNFLLGGEYSMTSNAEANTAYGFDAMSQLTNGSYNTAVGYNALARVTTGSYNTAVGYNAGAAITTQGYNTIAGNAMSSSAGSRSAGYNTLIGIDTAPKLTGVYNTFAGNYIGYNNTVTGAYNTALGNSSMNSISSGSYNTAIGYNALANVTTGSYNTAVGYNACTGVTTGYYKTCIGADSGQEEYDSYSGTSSSASTMTSYSNLFTDKYDRVFIGGYPRQLASNDDKAAAPAAVLEVHNVKSTINSTSPYPYPLAKAGNESVVINGNLIVRGITYLETPILRPTTMDSATEGFANIAKGLTAYKLMTVGNSYHAFAGFDGFDRTDASKESCNGCRSHAFNDMRPNCICTAVSSSMPYTNTAFNKTSSSWGLSTSYDWTSHADQSSSITDCRKTTDPAYGDSYTDTSFSKQISLSVNSGTNSLNNVDKDLKEVDIPYAHLPSGEYSGYSCCPDLRTSDSRLKDISGRFSAGIEELKKLNIYNYTFKDDQDKVPHAGVIAQDLKRVFPDAVHKNKNGYYEIRWDEMFYALINAVKDINTRVVNLAKSVSKDKDRITILKKDNAELTAQLDKLADELSALENKRK